MKVILAHGWGFDARVWDGVRAHLSRALEIETIDFGYFGAQKLGAGGTANIELAVGHSLGALWWLTQTDIAWRRLLCIDGFPRFAASDDFPGVAPRALARMRTQLAKDPQAVLDEFRARCGAPAAGALPDVARLDAGLAQLAELDGRATLAARRDDVWALAGNADPIVSPAMRDTAFAALPAGHLDCVDAPGHALPLTRPELCAQWIEKLAV